MLVHHRKFIPAFGIEGHRDQYPLSVYTVLSINERVGDCAAYEGIGPNEADDKVIERIKAGGNKIPEADAREMFNEIEDMGLRYRL